MYDILNLIELTKPNDTIYKSLKKIYGINNYLANIICKKFGFSNYTIMRELDENDLKRIVKFISSQNIKVDKELKYRLFNDIDRLYRIKNYRGLRHKMGLSVRGQRTHSNCKTQKRVGSSRFNFLKRFFSVDLTSNLLLNIKKKDELDKKKYKKLFKNCFRVYNYGYVYPFKHYHKLKYEKFRRKIVKKSQKKEFFLNSSRRNFYRRRKKNKKKDFFLDKLRNRKKIKKRYTCNIYVIIKYTNVLVYCYNTKNELLFWLSSGLIGFSGRSRGSVMACNLLSRELCKKLRRRRIKKISLLKFNGFGYKRRIFVQNLKKNRVQFNKLIYTNSVPFNGCRKKKLKRK